MNGNRARLIMSAALGLTLFSAVTGPANALQASEPGTQVEASAEQKYYWEWSDGHEKISRTFRQTVFGSQSRLPYIVATVEPTSPKRTVYLKFYQRGKWVLETKKKTNSRGEAALHFDPWCNTANTNWCDGTWKYKLSIGDVSKTFKITFVGK